ncbi:MAG: 50S ribosomal protein L13, partial [Chitinophagales bacterium]
GDYVIVLNSDKVHLSGNKWNDKKYIRYSGYPGGQKVVVAKDLNKKKTFAVLENAVRGMLPKNRLGRQMFKKLFVYEGAEHSHAAQQPKPLNIK